MKDWPAAMCAALNQAEHTVLIIAMHSTLPTLRRLDGGTRVVGIRRGR